MEQALIGSGPALAEVARLRSELAQAQEANKAVGAQLQTVLSFWSCGHQRGKQVLRV